MHNLGLKLNWLRLQVAMSHSRGLPIEGPRTPRLSTASHHARYLGPFMAWNATTAHEIQRRIKAASMAWFIFRSFWYNKIDQRLVKLVFRGIVVSILLSGLAAFVLRHKDTFKQIHVAKRTKADAGKSVHQDQRVRYPWGCMDLAWVVLLTLAVVAPSCCGRECCLMIRRMWLYTYGVVTPCANFILKAAYAKISA